MAMHDEDQREVIEEVVEEVVEDKVIEIVEEKVDDIIEKKVKNVVADMIEFNELKLSVDRDEEEYEDEDLYDPY